MAKCTCAISGLRFNTNFLDSLVLPANEGFPHPIFAAPKKYLERMYTAHCRGKLDSVDSYLLFMALLHSSDAIEWQHPATLNPRDAKTKAFIENHLKQLVDVLEKSATILHPSFEQPRFVVTYDNCNLRQIGSWIKAWEENVKEFYAGKANTAELDKLHNAEAKLSRLILSGELEENYTKEIADWASRAAEFPSDKEVEWKEVIRSCFNVNKMFNTPLATIKELKEFCECNIEVGSIHFHTLHKVLCEGISRHVDYLGGSSLALGYELLPPSSSDRPQLLSLSSINDNDSANPKLTNGADTHKPSDVERTLQLMANAPTNAPKSSDYPDNVSFLRAKLAYRVTQSAQQQAEARKQTELAKVTIETTKEGL